MAWFELASHLGMSVQRAKHETTSSEFVKWIWFLSKKKEEEITIPSKLDWYLARIAYEVASIPRMFSKNKRRIPLEKFILKFKSSAAKTKKKEKPEVSPETKAQNSKNFWMAVAGVTNDKTNNRKKRQLPDHVKQKSEIK